MLLLQPWQQSLPFQRLQYRHKYPISKVDLLGKVLANARNASDPLGMTYEACAWCNTGMSYACSEDVACSFATRDVAAAGDFMPHRCLVRPETEFDYGFAVCSVDDTTSFLVANHRLQVN